MGDQADWKVLFRPYPLGYSEGMVVRSSTTKGAYKQAMEHLRRLGIGSDVRDVTVSDLHTGEVRNIYVVTPQRHKRQTTQGVWHISEHMFLMRKREGMPVLFVEVRVGDDAYDWKSMQLNEDMARDLRDALNDALRDLED